MEDVKKAEGEEQKEPRAAESGERILVQVDKTVVKITGLSVRGLNIGELESLLRDRLKSLVRVIGVAGDCIEMDVYGLDEEDILRDEEGVIKTLALARGITVSDVAAMEKVHKIREVPFDEIPPYIEGECRGERWLKF